MLYIRRWFYPHWAWGYLPGWIFLGPFSWWPIHRISPFLMLKPPCWHPHLGFIGFTLLMLKISVFEGEFPHISLDSPCYVFWLKIKWKKSRIPSFFMVFLAFLMILMVDFSDCPTFWCWKDVVSSDGTDSDGEMSVSPGGSGNWLWLWWYYGNWIRNRDTILRNIWWLYNVIFFCFWLLRSFSRQIHARSYLRW